MTNETIKQILIEKGITHLYHANSVATASTFLENGGVFSRGAAEDRGLYQTSQETDDTDRDVDVFYDIFFDSVDIHQRIKKLNHYGPVLFVYSIDLIDTLPQGSIKITKDNPIRWKPCMEENKKYFSSEQELKLFLLKGEFAQHFTVRHQMNPLSFEYLEKIIIDDPGVDSIRYFENACRHLQDLLDEHLTNLSLEVRQCPLNCNCKKQYRDYGTRVIYHKFHFR